MSWLEIEPTTRSSSWLRTCRPIHITAASQIVHFLFYLNLASSDSEMNKNSENYNIADDTVNWREQSKYMAPKPKNTHN